MAVVEVVVVVVDSWLVNAMLFVFQLQYLKNAGVCTSYSLN